MPEQPTIPGLPERKRGRPRLPYDPKKPDRAATKETHKRIGYRGKGRSRKIDRMYRP